MYENRDKVEEIARRLSKNTGWTERTQYELGNGVSVPIWVTFISRAEQIFKEREALGK